MGCGGGVLCRHPAEILQPGHSLPAADPRLRLYLRPAAPGAAHLGGAPHSLLPDRHGGIRRGGEHRRPLLPPGGPQDPMAGGPQPSAVRQRPGTVGFRRSGGGVLHCLPDPPPLPAGRSAAPAGAVEACHRHCVPGAHGPGLCRRILRHAHRGPLLVRSASGGKQPGQAGRQGVQRHLEAPAKSVPGDAAGRWAGPGLLHLRQGPVLGQAGVGVPMHLPAGIRY